MGEQPACRAPLQPHPPDAGSHGGGHVEVEGSFDNWTTRQPLQYTGKDWTIIKLLPPGVYQVGNPPPASQPRRAVLP